MLRLQLRLARNAIPARERPATAALFVVAALIAGGYGCSKSPQPQPTPSPAAATEPATTAAPQIDLADSLTALTQKYSEDELETTLEALPILQPYFEDEDVTSGRLAAQAHWDRMPDTERAAFATCLGQIMDDAAQLQALSARLPNGFDDVALALPESRVLYEPILGQYGLGLESATSNDVASSLSTYHQNSILVSVAALLCEMSDGERADYLQRFRRAAKDVASDTDG